MAARGNADNGQWSGMSQADQLLVRGGRVVSLYDSGRYVVAYDLAHGRADPTNPLSSGVTSPNAWLRLVGPQLFIVQPNNVKRYDLADLTDTSMAMLPGVNAHVRGLLLGSDSAVIVDDPVDRGPAGSPRITLLAVTRAPIPGTAREQDLLELDWTRGDSSGITDWTAIDGGVCLLTGNHRLHALRGARPTP